MNDRFHEEDVLAKLIREAGDPGVSPDPQYADALRAKILNRVGKVEAPAQERERVQTADIVPTDSKRTHTMKRMARLAAAAAIFILVGIAVVWVAIGGGSPKLALADVAKALDGLRSATYDCVMEMKNPADGKTMTIRQKAFFLVPSRERVEMSGAAGIAGSAGNSIMIWDHQAMKSLVLVPEQKQATAMDLTKMKKPAGATNLFEMVRQLVRDGNSPGTKVELLGKKEISGQVAVGFQIHSNMADQTLWADPQTARLIRVEIDYPGGSGHGVMSNFCYDTELDPSLFSLEPPAGYKVDRMEAKMPVEEDLLSTLRLIAEHNDGTFPSTIGMPSEESLKALEVASKAETEKRMKEPEIVKLREDLQAQYGKDNDGFMKAWTKAMKPFNQKLTEKYVEGMRFYNLLNSENDSRYAGKGVKLDTPDRAIFWYKPTGAEKYRVIYADLTVKEMDADAVKEMPEAEAK